MQLRYESLCIKRGWVQPKCREIAEPGTQNMQLQISDEQPEQIKANKAESRNFPLIEQKNLEERLLETRNYMSIYGKFMSRCQLVLDMKYLNLDPLNPDSILIDKKKKKRRFSEHQVVDDEDDNDDLAVPA